MILMRVGEHQAGEVFPLRHQIADVGQDQIDARQMLFRGKRHAEIDREPLAAALVAEAVDRQIHADFADAAERREHQFLCGLAAMLQPFRPARTLAPAGMGTLRQRRRCGCRRPLDSSRPAASSPRNGR